MLLIVLDDILFESDRHNFLKIQHKLFKYYFALTFCIPLKVIKFSFYYWKLSVYS